jgi:hypothetical protein
MNKTLQDRLVKELRLRGGGQRLLGRVAIVVFIRA